MFVTRFFFYSSFNPADSATEFNDVSIISCFTGWLPEPLPLRFGHMSEVWKFLKETLPKYQWPDEKPKIVIEDEPIAVLVSELIKLNLLMLNSLMFLS